MTSWHEQTFTNAPAIHIEIEPQPAPAKGRPDEYWWVRLDEGMPPEPACVSFKGDAPSKVQLIGDDSACGTPIEDFERTHTDEDGVTTAHTRLEMIERILPPGRVGEVVAKLKEVRAERCYPGCCALESGLHDDVDAALSLLGLKAEA